METREEVIVWHTGNEPIDNNCFLTQNYLVFEEGMCLSGVTVDTYNFKEKKWNNNNNSITIKAWAEMPMFKTKKEIEQEKFLYEEYWKEMLYYHKKLKREVNDPR